MALPWLESLPVWGEEPRGKRVASDAPVRLAVLFSGNGFHSKEWWARGEGRQMELGKVLAPLQDFREKMLFVQGLFNAEALKGNIHSSQTGNLLSGAPLASGGEIRSGTSIDQLLAQRYGSSKTAPASVRAGSCGAPAYLKLRWMAPPRPFVGSVETTPRMDILYLTAGMPAAFTFLIIWQTSSIARSRSGDLPSIMAGYSARVM
ncbi:MAG: hypothetical protein B7Z55_00855 [Planctomycetales bacterium 12-60-4]|nr:MAG: hypothetical protein B7Z55_00855 [Planctomycetales bacterium 12-60-4]